MLSLLSCVVTAVNDFALTQATDINALYCGIHDITHDPAALICKQPTSTHNMSLRRMQTVQLRHTIHSTNHAATALL
jgi:hypothetical protein